MFFWGKKSKDDANDPALGLGSLKVKEQFEKQIAILSKVGILHTLTDGKTLGISGIYGKEHRVPTLEEVVAKIKTKEDLIAKKAKQGFVKLILVPFACPLETLIKKYEETLYSHYKNGTLLATREKPTDPGENLALNLEHPINVWNEEQNGDIKNNFIYFPQKYDKEDHFGKTKLEFITTPENAWQIFIIEDMPNIPKEGKGRTVGHRKQLETNQSPKEYLNILQTDKTYEGEEGLTPEADIVYALTHLEETNEVINDWQGKGNVSYELNTLLISSDSVPSFSWNRDFNRTDLWKFGVDNIDPCTGARVGIRI